MSYDENEIKKLIKEFINDKNKAVSIFQMLESESRIRDDKVRKQQQFLNEIKPMVQGNKDALTILEIVEKVISESKLSNDIYRFILYVLEAIVVDKPESIMYDEQKMLTDKDREALNWIHKYIEHSEGENSGQ